MSSSPADEVTLVERAAQSDPDAIASLYDRYAPKIYSYIYHRLSDPFLAEDLTGQVFLRMLEALRSERGWHSSFSGWLFRIAHNLIIDHYRRRDQAGFVAIDDVYPLPAHDTDPYQIAAAHLDSTALLEAIHRLTEEQAQVITLRFLEGYSINEVATLMEKSEGAIKALQYRAVNNLRRLLMGEEPL
ncbi:MAG: sigma-70 family RNA polymerase sigma factor [Anaerolineae bacterium]|nr:sigma-70 family RNA polymerase sigma factor [Caldilineales bacterium]MCX7851342.1 sigma-70 family RNA polymerase sigma factor [Caldilineales bacterium]MDW8267712.1 sigma-70 family RNA polymerase sigma factor [Anaerolineae bacterium]